MSKHNYSKTYNKLQYLVKYNKLHIYCLLEPIKCIPR